MKLKKILQNSIMETIFYTIIAIVGLLKVKYIISGLGSEMNGYYQFINNIISYIVLAEAGISSAILYKMYKPIADKDWGKVSELFSGSRKILKFIGVLFIGIALVISPILYLYTKNISLFIEITFCFFMLIFAVALPYLYGTRSYTTVLTADQNRFVYGLVYNISRLLTDIFIIVLVLIFKSIIAIVIINLLFKILETIVITSYCKKKYNMINEKAKPDTSAKKMSGDMICHQIGGVVFNNVDSVLLMTFLGPIYVSIYSAYNYIITFIREIFDKNNQMIANIFGYSFAKEDKNLLDMYNNYNSVFSALSLIICICFSLGARGFIGLWIGKSDYILSFIVICAFSLIIMFNILLTNISTMFQSNGLFKESKFFPLIESFLNIVISIILLQKIGILGILLATSISNLIGLIMRTTLLHKKVFSETSYLKLIKRPLITIMAFILICVPMYYVEPTILNYSTNYMNWFISMAIIFVIVTILILSIYYCLDKPMKNSIKIILKKLTGGKTNEQSK